MKVIKLFLLIFILGCTITTKNKDSESNRLEKKVVDDTMIVHKDSLVLNGNEGNWYFKKKLYSGYAVKYYTNDSLKEKTGFFNGKKQGAYKVWFENGVLQLETHYNQNVLVNTYKAWWINGVLALESIYINGEKQGVERQWYADGNLSKERNLLEGQENGLQRAWLQNGKIYVNYEAKNGRTFGMRRANLCYQLKNEKIAENKTK
jgi:antitoxin component YwqK of YwqJK toxin-antitoxin module